MQTSLARRQRHRRALQRRPQEDGPASTIGQVLLAFLVVLIATGGLLAGSGAVVAMGAYNYYAAGLPDPVAALTNIPFEQQTIIYDRTGKIELARLGDLKRELVDLRPDLPGEMLDATTAIEDKDFWVNPGFDPAGIVSAGLDTVSGKPARRLDHHPAARPCPAPAALGVRRHHLRAQGARDHPVDPADPGVPGRGRQAGDHHRLPQPELLRQPELWREGRGQGLLRQVARQADAGPGRHPRRHPAVADASSTSSATPRRSASTPNIADGEECTNFKLVVPQDSEIVQRRNKVLDLMETRSPLTGNKHTLAEYEAAKTEPVELVPQVSAEWKAPHFVWQVRRDLGQMYCPDTPSDCPEVDTKGLKVITTLDWTMQKATEKWVYVAARAPNAKDPTAAARQPQDPALGAVVDPGPARPQHQQRRGSRRGLPDRRDPRLRRIGQLHLEGQQEVPAQVRRAVRRLAPARIGHQADRLRRSAIDDKTLTAATMFMDVTTNFGGNFIPTQADKLERGPVRAPLGAPVLAQHPGHQGDDHERPRPRLRADPGIRPDLSRRRPCRSCRWASGRSRSIRSTCSAHTARSPTAAC